MDIKFILHADLAMASVAIFEAFGAYRMNYYRDDSDDGKWYDGGPDDDAIDEDDPEFSSPTGSDRLPEESDEDYQERMEDLYGY